MPSSLPMPFRAVGAGTGPAVNAGKNVYILLEIQKLWLFPTKSVSDKGVFFFFSSLKLYYLNTFLKIKRTIYYYQEPQYKEKKSEHIIHPTVKGAAVLVDAGALADPAGI